MGVILQVLGVVITFTMAMEALRRFGFNKKGLPWKQFLPRSST